MEVAKDNATFRLGDSHIFTIATVPNDGHSSVGSREGCRGCRRGSAFNGGDRHEINEIDALGPQGTAADVKRNRPDRLSSGLSFKGLSAVMSVSIGPRIR